MADGDKENGTITTEVLPGGVWRMGINRPAKLNGFTPEMFEALAAAYARLDADPDLRVGVLFAHGPHFTAGLDLPRFAGHFGAARDFASSGEGEGIDLFGRRPPWRVKPLIAAVRGITFTAGLELALAADIIVAGSDTRLAMMEPKRGLMAAGGATFRMVERGGWGNAMRWLLTGDEFDAEEGRRIGIIQEIVSPELVLDRATELAQMITARAPLAVQATRANALTYALEGEAACIAGFGAVSNRMAATEDFAEGLQSFIEKRPAVFKGR